MDPIPRSLTGNFLIVFCRSKWPRGLRLRSAAARLLRLWVRIPPGAWMAVCCECCVLSGRGICDELITRPEESYRMLCVVVCDLETSWMRRPWPTGGAVAPKRKKKNSVLENVVNSERHVWSSRSCCSVCLGSHVARGPAWCVMLLETFWSHILVSDTTRAYTELCVSVIAL